MPFNFRRLQFPVPTVSIRGDDLSQGQSLKVTWIYLEKLRFSHGHLYNYILPVLSSHA